MKGPLRAVALVSAIVASFSCGIAMADPTDDSENFGAEEGLRTQVVVPVSLISKMSAAYSVDTFNCTTTETSMLTRTITQSSPGTVSVNFQAESFPGCKQFITLRRNGAIVPGPGDAVSPMVMHDTEGPLSTNGFNWIVRVGEGNYKFDVTCKCESGTALVDERSLIIYHR